MRWHEKKIVELGDKREITKFLWFPLKINKETRWLEMTTIEQKYSEKVIYGEEGAYIKKYWLTLRFVTP